MNDRIYLLYSLYDDGHGNYNQEFLLGVFGSQERVLKEKEEVEKQSNGNNEYRIEEHIVIN